MNWIVKKHNIWTHILLTYFTCGIWLIIWLYYKNKYKRNIHYNIKININDNSSYNETDYEEFINIQNKYKKVLDEHYNNIEKINMLYTVINNLALPSHPEMNKVINLCEQDIQLAPIILEYCKEMANHYNDKLENHLINYVTFQRLAIIYEKQKEYQKAIDVCKYAITLGFYKDGTAGQMPGRLARLIKKARSENVTITE